MSRLRASLVAWALWLAACGVSPSPARPTATPGTSTLATSWSHFAEALAGSWEADGSSARTVHVSYERTSRGSALLETWQSGSPAETITVYHPDGDALLLTHYCGQGNQARLRSVAASESRVVFQRFEATNLSAAQSVLDELVLELGSGRLRRIETYASATGERETTELVFHRAPPPAAP